MPWALFFSRFFYVGPRDRRWHVPVVLRQQRYTQWMNNRIQRAQAFVPVSGMSCAMPAYEAHKYIDVKAMQAAWDAQIEADDACYMN